VNRLNDRGQVTAYLVVWVLAILVVAGLVIDGGYTLAARRRAINEADAAARAGAQALQPAALRTGDALPDPARAVAAAHAYLARTGHHGSVEVTGDRVLVTVSFDQPMYILGMGGIASITVTGHGDAQPLRGVTTEEP
jgi:hypothetical protein